MVMAGIDVARRNLFASVWSVRAAGFGSVPSIHELAGGNPTGNRLCLEPGIDELTMSDIHRGAAGAGNEATRIAATKHQPIGLDRFKDESFPKGRQFALLQIIPEAKRHLEAELLKLVDMQLLAKASRSMLRHAIRAA